MNSVVTLLLSHQEPADLEAILRLWQSVTDPDSIVVAYGGHRDQFDKIEFDSKLFIDDPGLRTRDHQRERQSYSGILRRAGQWMKSRPGFQHVHFVEYDHVPLVSDLYERMIDRLKSENADALAFHLRRIDGTSDAHYLHHANESRFHDFFSSVTRRHDPRVVLAMLGTGSFWKREAFEAVIAQENPFPIYAEIYLPTLAHHLGFRIRDIPDQNKFVRHIGNRHAEIDTARKEGAWTLHPVKTLPGSLGSLT